MTAKIFLEGADDALDRPEKASRANLNAFVQQQLCRAIVLGKYSPGERLNIRQLADELGTSVTPVREALMRLSASHILESRPGQFRVPLLSRERYIEICNIRVVIECMAAEEATRHITPEELATVEAEAAEYIAAIRTGNFRRAVEQYSKFKLAMYQASRMPVLLSMVENLLLQVAPFFAYSLQPVPPGDNTWFENNIQLINQIIAGLKRKDIGMVRFAVEGIIRNATDRVLVHYESGDLA